MLKSAGEIVFGAAVATVLTVAFLGFGAIVLFGSDLGRGIEKVALFLFVVYIVIIGMMELDKPTL